MIAGAFLSLIERGTDITSEKVGSIFVSLYTGVVVPILSYLRDRMIWFGMPVHLQ